MNQRNKGNFFRASTKKMLNLAIEVSLNIGTPLAVRAFQRPVTTKSPLQGQRGLPATSPIYLVTRSSLPSEPGASRSQVDPTTPSPRTRPRWTQCAGSNPEWHK